MLVGSLFSGIGGFEVGTLSVFTQAEIVWQIEIDSYCQSILHKRFPHSQKYRDITQVQGAELQDIDLLLCGFPCQDLSIANNTRQTGNINGKKSGLWWEAHRIIKDKQPKYIMLENVSAITFRDKGGMAVLRSLAELGYDAWWDCIQAQEMGAPHIRERWFCICIRQDDTANTNHKRGEEHTVRPRTMEPQQLIECTSGEAAGLHTTNYWERPTTISPLCGVDDGIPNRLARIRALGNAIVPQCAAMVAHKLKQIIQEITCDTQNQQHKK